MKRFTIIILSVFAVALTVTLSASDKVREEKLQQAIDLIESKGDLAKATPLLEDVAKSPDRALAARGLLQLAQAQERFSKADAVATYQRIVDGFGGTAETAATKVLFAAAMTRLEAIGQKNSGLVARHVWDDEGDSVSPDGRYLTFTDWNTGDLAIHELPAGPDRHLTANGKWNDNFGEGGLPSPDSRRIVYSWYDNTKELSTLRVIGRDGGQPHVVYANEEKADTVWPIGWSADGKWILVTIDKSLPTPAGTPRLHDREMKLISESGGTARLIKRFERLSDFAMNPSLSPDAQSVAYNWRPVAGKPARDIYILSIDSGKESPLIQHPSDDDMLGWAPGGDRILFASDRGGSYGIWAARVAGGRTQGEPMLIRPDTPAVSSNGFTRQGDFYYRVRTVDSDVFVASIDPGGSNQSIHPVRLESRFVGGKLQAVWSPDGNRIAYVKEMTSSDAAPVLAIQELASGATKQLTVSLQNMNNPSWMQDGRAVIVQGRDEQGRQGLHRINVDTGALTTLAVREPSNDIRRGYASASPDGRVFFLWSSPTNVAEGGIAVRDLVSGTEQKVTTSPIARLALSPDGKWLAATRSNTERDPHLFVMPSSGGDPRPVAAAVAAWAVSEIAWSADSRNVLVVKNGQRNKEIWLVPIDGSEPRNTGIIWAGGIARISVRPDGRLALSSTGRSSATWVLQNLPTMKEK